MTTAAERARKRHKREHRKPAAPAVKVKACCRQILHAAGHQANTTRRQCPSCEAVWYSQGQDKAGGTSWTMQQPTQ